MKSSSTQLRNELNTIKEKAIETIKEIMAEQNTATINFRDCNDCPIIIDGGDDDTTYTLDKIWLDKNGKLAFDCSSWDDCKTVTGKNADVSVLIDVLEYLEKYEGIVEFADEDDEEEEDDDEDDEEE